MLKSILNVEGAQMLGRDETKQILGGYLPGICPSEGNPCLNNDPLPFPCMAGPQNLCCINGVYVAVVGDNCIGGIG